MAPTESATGDARQRRGVFRDHLAAAGLDGAIVTDRGNFSYLTGYPTPSWENRSRPMALLVHADGPVHAVVSEDEGQRLAEWDNEILPLGYRDPSGSVASWSGPSYAAATVDAIVDGLEGSSWRRLAIEESGPSLAGLPRAAMAALETRLHASLVDLDALIWPLRLRKTPFEVGRLRAAAEALSLAFSAFAERGRPGMTESELHAEFTAAALRSGPDRLAYLVVVAGPHRPMLGPPTDREWREGDLLSVDACLTYDGYWADYCRHYAAVEPTAEQARAYASMVEGLQAGRDAIVAGTTFDVSASAMAAALGADSTGFGRLGHGIGVDLAEPPSLHPDDRTRIETGMTVCVEPSAEYGGVGRLVAEEMVVVTEDGTELLSPAFPPELQVLA